MKSVPHNSSNLTKFPLQLKDLEVIQAKMSTLPFIPDEKTVLPECQHYLRILAQPNLYSKPDECFRDPSVQAFFFTNFLIANTRNILKCKTIGSLKMETTLSSCLKQTVCLIRRMAYSQNDFLWHLLNLIVKPVQPYYCCKSHYNLPVNMSDPEKNIFIQEEASASASATTHAKAKTIGDYFFDDLKKNLREALLVTIIYDKVSHKTNHSTLKILPVVCSIVRHLYDKPAEDFANRYCSKVTAAICDQLTHHPEFYTVNFTNKAVKRIFRGLELFLERTSTSPQEKCKALDMLKLQIAIICLDSQAPNIILLGMRIFNDVLDQLEDPTSAQRKIWDKSVYYDLICSVFGKIYQNDSLINQFIKDSLRLLSYMYTRGLFANFAELRILWKYLKAQVRRDQDFLRKIICDIFKGFPCSDSNSNLLWKIINEDLDRGDTEILSLIYEKHRFSGDAAAILRTMYRNILELYDGKLVDTIFYNDFIFKNYKELCSYSVIMYLKIDPFDQIKDYISNERGLKFGRFRMIKLWAQEVLETKDESAYRYLAQLYTEGQVMDSFLKYLRKWKNSQNLSSPEMFEKINFIHHLLCNQLPEKPFLTYDVLCELWEIFVEEPFISQKTRNYFKDTLHNIVVSKNISICMPSSHLKRFLCEKLAIRKMKGSARCFNSLFLALNKSLGKIWATDITDFGENIMYFTVKAAPEELEGFDALLDLIMYGNQDLIADLCRICDFLEDRFEPDLPKIRKKILNKCFKYIEQKPIDGDVCSQKEYSDRCLNFLSVIQWLMINFESNGIGKIITHSKLVKHGLITLKVVLYESDESEDPIKEIKAVQIEIDSNSYVYELLKEIARLCKMCWDEIAIDSVDQNNYGKTLIEIGIKNGQRLLVSAMTKKVVTINLLRDKNKMDPRAKKVFCRLFEDYSDGGKMSLEQFVAFLDIHRSVYFPNPWERESKDKFSYFDIDRDGYLTLDNFLKFSFYLCKERECFTRRLLQANYIRQDLRERADIDSRIPNKNCLASYIISSNRQHFQLLFSLLTAEENIASEAWELLTRMPTDPDLFRNMLELRGVRGIKDAAKRDWNLLLDLNSKYKLLYALNIIEYLMHYSLNNRKIMPIEDAKLIKYQKTWQADFVNYDGLDHLYRVFELFKPDASTVSEERTKQAYKRVLDFANAMKIKLSDGNYAILGVKKERSVSISRFVELANQYEKCFLDLLQADT